MSFPQLPTTALQGTTGSGGWVRLEPNLYIVTWDNNFVADLTPHLIDMSVTHDTSRTASHWILDATITYDGWLKLRPFVDWIAPYLRVTYADGTSKRQQLGRYLVLDSPEHREETGGTVRIDARDVLWVLNMQGIPGILIAPHGPPPAGIIITLPPSLQPPPVINIDFRQTIVDLIEGATVPGAPAGAKLYHQIINIPALVGPDGPIYDTGTPRLEAINDLLQWGAAYFPLQVDHNGVLSVRKREFLWHSQPVRRWLANAPLGPFQLGALPTPIDPSAAERISPIAEAIESTPMTADIVDQVIVMGGTVYPVQGSASIGTTFASAGALPFQRSVKRLFTPYATSVATANSIAAGYLETLLTENTSLTLMVEPDPNFVATHETVELGIWDAAGRQIANGKYAVNRVRYGFMPENPLMQVEVSTLDAFIPLGQL